MSEDIVFGCVALEVCTSSLDDICFGNVEVGNCSGIDETAKILDVCSVDRTCDFQSFLACCKQGRECTSLVNVDFCRSPQHRIVAEQGEKLFRYKYPIEIVYGSVGVEDVVAENINVYPNPAKSVVNVYAENLNKVTVYNSVGQLVYTENVDEDNLVIDVASWTNGLYYINLETKSGAKSSQKIVVNK